MAASVPKRELIIVVLLIAAAAVFLARQQGQQLHYQLPQLEDVASSQVNKIVIQGPQRHLIVVKRDNGRWQLQQKGYYVADSRVTAMIEGVVSLKLAALVTHKETQQVRRRYGLAGPQRLAVALYGSSEELLRRCYIGNLAATKAHTLVALPGKEGVFQATGNLRQAYGKSAPQLRDKAVLGFAPEQVQKLALYGPSQVLKAQRSADQSQGWQLRDAPGQVDNLDAKMARLLQQAAGLRAQAYTSQAQLPAAEGWRLQLTLESGDQQQLWLNAASQEEEQPQYKGRSSYAQEPFILYPAHAEPLVEQMEKLLSSKGQAQP